MNKSGFIIAAPASGSGKTILTLGLLRAFRNRGESVGSLKIGPDYIDPSLHSVASGKKCRNLDFWGMREETLSDQLNKTLDESDLIIAEGVMGLFDGAATGNLSSPGSTADASNWSNFPIVLVVDVKGQGSSVAALVEGFLNHRSNIRFAGIILNRVGSDRHFNILEDALVHLNIPCFGGIPEDNRLKLPQRHLGLIQADELDELEDWLDNAADIISDSINLNKLNKIEAIYDHRLASQGKPCVPQLGAHTAIARDKAFSFSYSHIVDGWRERGTKITFFSPLAGELPDPSADSIYLPGGYPELYANELENMKSFKRAIKTAADKGSNIYGECGGFMVLGQSLIDECGVLHKMVGLLPIETSFQNPSLHLGYRELELISDGEFGKAGTLFKGHEFHYCNLISNNKTLSLFQAKDAKGQLLPDLGCKSGTVMGSFAHIIDSV
ncbi:MAG: cobyrinate a,c-diamide synthase [Pseudomonadota bacterium]|nr:cobyrinate a,c-diamide synthase [Pseudomonadota bacterium]